MGANEGREKPSGVVFRGSGIEEKGYGSGGSVVTAEKKPKEVEPALIDRGEEERWKKEIVRRSPAEERSPAIESQKDGGERSDVRRSPKEERSPASALRTEVKEAHREWSRVCA